MTPHSLTPHSRSAGRRAPSLVSVVVPARNARPEIDEQLEALAVQDYAGPWEVVVSDNGSTDGLREHLERHPLREKLSLRVVDSADVPGAAHARNVGARHARGDLVAVVDADDRVHSEWLRELVAVAADHDSVGGAREVESINSPEVAQWRPMPDPSEQPTLFRFLPVAVSCNFAVWKDVLDELGGWDESYDVGGEDLEFCLRLQLAGFTLGYAPDAVIAYRLRDTLRGLWRQCIAYGRADARLYRDFREHGMPRRSSIALADTLAYIVLRNPLVPRMIRRNSTGMWVFHLASLVGRIRGSVENRVFYV
ncbi:glycosyltransferase [Rhodococcus sp. Z13]|uniref:Glycosyltransferase n=1 Tax=Rhodococcus sacchari TaxID=2962047 RepID=A0ACD4DI96_9NOCA|nr:glycosyltransferase [Rhodococcus sp. Z13]UYP19737.1 glycosyltransferase [Rhodococcus sp. Z13]